MSEPPKTSELSAAVETAIRRVMADEELTQRFWAAGYKQLTNHATAEGSQWLGKRILTALVVAITTAGLVWLVKTGAIK